MSENPVLQEFLFAVDDHVQTVGDTYALKGIYPLFSYTLGSHTVSLMQGVAYDLQFSNVQEGILVTGTLKADGCTACDLCLEPAKLELDIDVNQLFFFQKPSQEEEDELEDDVYVLSQNHIIDVGELIYLALAAETPFVITCCDECKGLCPKCGKNLNKETCTCKEEKEEAHPFSGLAALRDELASKEQKTHEYDTITNSNEKKG